jgi:hypothetical protein
MKPVDPDIVVARGEGIERREKGKKEEKKEAPARG